MIPTKRTDEAIKDSFQTGPHYKVKAEAMRLVERRYNWLFENLSAEETIKLFGTEILSTPDGMDQFDAAIDKKLTE